MNNQATPKELTMVKLQAANRLQALNSQKVLEITSELQNRVRTAQRKMGPRASGAIQQAKDDARKALKAEGLPDASIQNLLSRY
jgi:hypothetical protein